MHDVLVDGLVKLEVKLTDQLHMTIAVYWGVKPQARPKLIIRPTCTLITFTALKFFIYLLLLVVVFLSLLLIYFTIFVAVGVVLVICCCCCC